MKTLEKTVTVMTIARKAVTIGSIIACLIALELAG